MNNSFTQRVLTTIMLGFFAACLLWFMRHIVESAFYETGAGWKDMFNKTPQHQHY